MARTVILPPSEPTSSHVKAGGWWHDASDGQRLVCDLCPRACSLAEGDRGFCFVRQNLQGRMVLATYGRSTGFCIDPIEKKPLNQFYPGTATLSFGTAGCNLGCKFCQNWTSSKSRRVEVASEVAEPETIARAAEELGCRSVAFTYNDPVVWAEYAIDTARICRQRGIKTVAVTAGYIQPEARRAFFEFIDAANVDLKAFSEEFYWRMAGAHLAPVLDTIRWLVNETDVWVELTNLVIPQANDSGEEIQRMCDWILNELGADVPLHFTAFHPDFRLTDREPTPPQTLVQAYETARAAGLHYVYTGNLCDPAHESTYCPACNQKVIHRDRYSLGAYELVDGFCRHCAHRIAGHFDAQPGDWGARRETVPIASYARAKSSVPLFEDDEDRPKFSPQQEQRIFQAAGLRVVSVVRGQTPLPLTELLGDTAVQPLYGAFVSLKRGGQLRSCCGYLGESIPLASAVEQAAVRAAKEDPRFPPISSEELGQLDMDVWLLWGPEPMTARGEDRVHCVQIGRHGLQVARGSRRGLLLPGVAVEHHLDARRFLEQVCLKAGLPMDAWLRDDTAVFTFEGFAIHGSLESALRGARQPLLRPPAVAGTFYPAESPQVQRMLDEMLPAQATPEFWAGALVPHAGWRYSGRLACQTLARVRIPSQVIVLCPKHRPGGADWAVAPFDAWQIPGTAVPSDPALAQRLAASISGLELDATAHRQEHAIEVQLPMLARLAPEAKVLGITIGDGSLDRLEQFGEQLAGVLRPMESRPLLVISSDMNHFANDADTRHLDRLALDAIEARDPQRLFETVQRHRISMCGVRPAVIVMCALRSLGLLHRCERVGYTTSAEASGDTQRVVGYAGALFG